MDESQLVGVFRLTKRGAYVETLGPERTRKVGLTDASGYAQDGDVVRLSIAGQGRRGPIGRIEGVLGGATVLEAAVNAAVASYGLPAGGEDGAAAAPKRVRSADCAGREDLRHMPLVTIDGATAQDFDDAVYAQPESAGWRLFVAIADVAHYVPVDSALDAAARIRGTSVYFPENVIPMLPKALSHGICSLRPNEDRLALVCEMHVNRRGGISACRFYEAVMRSRARLTYSAVESFHQGGRLPVDDGVRQSLKVLFAVYRALRRAREARGALDFEPVESTLTLAGGAVKAIEPVVRHQSHGLIEEAMIAANVCAAKFLEQHQVPGLHRVHEPPDPAKIEDLASAFKLAGAALPKQGLTAPALQKALRVVRPRPDAWLFERLTLQALQRALYVAQPRGHFALALERYTHFTSPIRRYPDLVVHRVIKAVLRNERNALPSLQTLMEIGHSASMAERRAEDATRMVDAWLKCSHLAPRMGEAFAAVIAGVTEFGLFAELNGYCIQGLLHVTALGDDYFRYVPPFHLVGEATGVSYRLGEPLEVRLAGAQPELGRLNLELAHRLGPSRDARSGRPRRGRWARRSDR